MAVVGIYYLQRPGLLYDALRENLAQNVRTQGELQLTDALQTMITNGRLMCSFQVQAWHDCGKPETLLSTNRQLLRERFMPDAEELGTRFENTVIKPPVCIAASAHVEDSILGPYVTIAENAVVVRSIIANSILNEGSEVRDAHLSDSIIGNRATVSEKALRLNVGDNSEVIFG